MSLLCLDDGVLGVVLQHVHEFGGSGATASLRAACTRLRCLINASCKRFRVCLSRLEPLPFCEHIAGYGQQRLKLSCKSKPPARLYSCPSFHNVSALEFTCSSASWPDINLLAQHLDMLWSCLGPVLTQITTLHFVTAGCRTALPLHMILDAASHLPRLRELALNPNVAESQAWAQRLDWANLASKGRQQAWYQLPNGLTSLTMTDDRSFLEATKHVAQLPALASLCWNFGCYSGSDTPAAGLPSKLQRTCMPIRNRSDLSLVAGLTKLTRLDLIWATSSLHPFNPRPVSLDLGPERVLEVLQRLPALQHLKLIDFECQPALQQLSSLTALTSLTLYNTQLPNNVLPHLPRLQHLHLWSSSSPALDVSTLFAASALKSLHLNCTEYVDNPPDLHLALKWGSQLARMADPIRPVDHGQTPTSSPSAIVPAPRSASTPTSTHASTHASAHASTHASAWPPHSPSRPPSPTPPTPTPRLHLKLESLHLVLPPPDLLRFVSEQTHHLAACLPTALNQLPCLRYVHLYMGYPDVQFAAALNSLPASCHIHVTVYHVPSLEDWQCPPEAKLSELQPFVAAWSNPSQVTLDFDMHCWSHPSQLRDFLPLLSSFRAVSKLKFLMYQSAAQAPSPAAACLPASCQPPAGQPPAAQLPAAQPSASLPAAPQHASCSGGGCGDSGSGSSSSSGGSGSGGGGSGLGAMSAGAQGGSGGNNAAAAASGSRPVTLAAACSPSAAAGSRPAHSGSSTPVRVPKAAAPPTIRAAAVVKPNKATAAASPTNAAAGIKPTKAAAAAPATNAAAAAPPTNTAAAAPPTNAAAAAPPTKAAAAAPPTKAAAAAPPTKAAVAAAPPTKAAAAATPTKAAVAAAPPTKAAVAACARSLFRHLATVPGLRSLQMGIALDAVASRAFAESLPHLLPGSTSIVELYFRLNELVPLRQLLDTDCTASKDPFVRAAWQHSVTHLRSAGLPAVLVTR